jgi:hypothetical protein
VGVELNHMTERKPGPLQIAQYSLGGGDSLVIIYYTSQRACDVGNLRFLITELCQLYVNPSVVDSKLFFRLVGSGSNFL